MKRVLLSLLVIGGFFYPALVFFAGNGADPPADEPKLAAQNASSEQATPPYITAVEQAQAAEKPNGADAMAPAVPNSRHAIAVGQAPSSTPAETQSPAPSETQSQAPAQAQPQAAAEAPSQTPAPQASPPKPEGGTPPSPQSSEAAPDAKPNQPEFVKVTAPTSVRKGASASSAIIGIAHTGAEAQVVSRDSDWVQIIDPDSKKTGWIQQSFLVPQTAPSSRPASQQEIDAALAAPAGDTTASADNEPSAKSRSHKHGSNHRHHRRAFAWGFIFRHSW
jgi:Bacterial SH3 domain